MPSIPKRMLVAGATVSTALLPFAVPFASAAGSDSAPVTWYFHSSNGSYEADIQDDPAGPASGRSPAGSVLNAVAPTDDQAAFAGLTAGSSPGAPGSPTFRVPADIVVTSICLDVWLAPKPGVDTVSVSSYFTRGTEPEQRFKPLVGPVTESAIEADGYMHLVGVVSYQDSAGPTGQGQVGTPSAAVAKDESFVLWNPVDQLDGAHDFAYDSKTRASSITINPTPGTCGSSTSSSTASATVSPTASATSSASGSASPTATPSDTATATMSPSATPTASVALTASPSPSGNCTVGLLSVLDRTVTIGQPARVQYRGRPGETPKLEGYFRVRGQQPEYGTVRPPVTRVPADGVLTWTLSPESNMRLRAVDGCGTSNSELLLVHLKMTIKAVRHGPRDYTFSGTFSPGSRNVGRPITLYYKTASGRAIRRAVTDNYYGTWSTRIQFRGSGQFRFFTYSGDDLVNQRGYSPERSTVIH